MKKLLVLSILLTATIISFGGYDGVYAFANKNNPSDSDDVSVSLNYAYGNYFVSTDVSINLGDSNSSTASSSAAVYTTKEYYIHSEYLENENDEINTSYRIGYTSGLGYQLVVSATVDGNTTNGTSSANAVVSW